MFLNHKWPDTLKIFEKIIVLILLALMVITIVATVAEPATSLFRQLVRLPILSLDTRQAVEIFGFFLTVLIGLELLESTKIYLGRGRSRNAFRHICNNPGVGRRILSRAPGP